MVLVMNAVEISEETRTSQPGDIDVDNTVASFERILSHFAYQESAVRLDLESRRVHDRLNNMGGISTSKCESKISEYRKGFARWIRDIDSVLAQLSSVDEEDENEQYMNSRLVRCKENIQKLYDLAARFQA